MATSINGKAYKAQIRDRLESIKSDCSDVHIKLKIDKISEIVTFSCKKLDENKLFASQKEIDELMDMFAQQVEKNIIKNIEMVSEKLITTLRRIF